MSAAHHGAYIWGSDIDFLTLHARTKPTRVKQVRTEGLLVNKSCNLIFISGSSQNYELHTDSAHLVKFRSIEFFALLYCSVSLSAVRMRASRRTWPSTGWRTATLTWQ